MRLSINLCAHDGIISEYTGVATMVQRYIKMIHKILDHSNIEFQLNLITPQYNTDSFGYSSSVLAMHDKLPNTNIIQLSNGSDGKINFGSIENWQTLTKNAADYINAISNASYDKIITIYNDVPYTSLASLLSNQPNHIKIWIPHSTVKIHDTDAFTKKDSQEYNSRLKLECDAINFINNTDNNFVAYISTFMKEHLVNEYALNQTKLIELLNGEIVDDITHTTPSPDALQLYQQVQNYDQIILSFGRAEKYKNHEATMLLGKAMNIKPIVAVHGYYKGQPIMNDYIKLSQQTNATVFIDPPYDFVKVLLERFKNTLIMLIPSTKEPMGLIVNEVRKLNKPNILIVANNIPGLREQITDGVDGVLVDLSNIQASAEKIQSYLDRQKMQQLMFNAQETLRTKYNFNKCFEKFFDRIMKI